MGSPVFLETSQKVSKHFKYWHVLLWNFQAAWGRGQGGSQQHTSWMCNLKVEQISGTVYTVFKMNHHLGVRLGDIGLFLHKVTGLPSLKGNKKKHRKKRNDSNNNKTRNNSNHDINISNKTQNTKNHLPNSFFLLLVGSSYPMS